MNRGDVIIFPTDTIYGIGCKLYDKMALDKIFTIKQRDPEKHIPILISQVIDLIPIAKYDFRTLLIMQKFWPGPLTIVLETTLDFYEKTGEDTIAVRIPNHDLALDLIEQNGPLRTTSVNISGQPPLNTYKEINDKFSKKVTKIYGEHVEDYIGVASTIVDATVSGQLTLIREGAILFSDILEVYNK